MIGNAFTEYRSAGMERNRSIRVERIGAVDLWNKGPLNQVAYREEKDEVTNLTISTWMQSQIIGKAGSNWIGQSRSKEDRAGAQEQIGQSRSTGANRTEQEQIGQSRSTGANRTEQEHRSK
jgi:hypothetical protein